MKWTFSIIVLSLLFTFGMTGCDRTAAAAGPDNIHPLDVPCQVQFKRDVLGARGDRLFSPLTDAFDGVEAHVNGKLVKINDEWVVIDRDGDEIWIPRENVLLLEFPKMAQSGS